MRFAASKKKLQGEALFAKIFELAPIQVLRVLRRNSSLRSHETLQETTLAALARGLTGGKHCIGGWNTGVQVVLNCWQGQISKTPPWHTTATNVQVSPSSKWQEATLALLPEGNGSWCISELQAFQENQVVQLAKWIMCSTLLALQFPHPLKKYEKYT